MDFKLNFRSKAIEQEFLTSHNLSTGRSDRLVNILLAGYALTYTTRYIADLLFNPDFNLSVIVTGIIIIYSSIVVFCLAKCVFKKFKISTQKIDIIILLVSLSALVLMNNPFRTPKTEGDVSYEMFWNAYEIGMFSLIIIQLMRRWFHKMLYFFASSIYFIIMEQNNIHDRLMSIKIIGFIIMTSLLFYFTEKGMRIDFMEKYNQDVSTKHILTALPEGILIIDDKFKCLHSNPSLKKIFPKLDPMNQEAIQNFIKQIKSPKPRTLFKDFKSKITEKIFLAQESSRVPRFVYSNSVISEEASVHINSGILTTNTARLKSLYTAPNKEKEGYGIERMDSNELPNSPIHETNNGESPISFHTYLQAFFKLFQDAEKLTINYEEVLEHYYFDATYEDKSLEISISSIDFLHKRCFLLIFRDKTYRELIEKLETSTKYKSQVLSTVSHELRTPVTSSLHLLNELIESPDIPLSSIENYIKPTKTILHMMLNLINDILDFSQINEKKLKLVYQPVDLRKIINQTMTFIEIQAKKKGLALEVEVDSIVPQVIETDPNRLTQILLNLLSNALKFTTHGKITISASVPPNEEGLIVISVQDTGIGIKEEDLKKLFVEFEKIELGANQALNTNGCGLGLTIANKLAKYLSRDGFGGISVFSEPEKGSTFSFILENKKRTKKSGFLTQRTSKSLLTKLSKANTIMGDHKVVDIFDVSLQNISEIIDGEDYVNKGIPKQIITLGSNKKKASNMSTNEPSPVESGQPSRQRESKCSCPKILVVDDDAFNQLTLENMLKPLNYTVKGCFNGEEAVKEVKRRAMEKTCEQECTNFEAIFMDSSMPIKNGLEATREIKQFLKDENLKSIPIIGLSSNSVETGRNESLAAGMDFYLPKPIAKDMLKEILWKIRHGQEC